MPTFYSAIPSLLGTSPPVSFVHHGSLAVDRAIDPEFRKAEKYLRGDSIMRRTLDHLEHSRTTTKIVGNPVDLDFFLPPANAVQWDPYSALRTSGGGRQSPALGLGHELAHADEDSRTRARLEMTKVKRYDDAEERRVILGPEAHAARTLGESTREDHRGSTYRVAAPTSR